jgi:hypothetical protein
MNHALFMGTTPDAHALSTLMTMGLIHEGGHADRAWRQATNAATKNRVVLHMRGLLNKDDVEAMRDVIDAAHKGHLVQDQAMTNYRLRQLPETIRAP